MKLSKIEIKNFRSIENLTIESDPSCQIFVGINESGKSNILKAISMLSRPINYSSDNIRLEGKGEDPVEDAFVKYYFNFDETEADILIETIKTEMLNNSFFISSFIEETINQRDLLIKYIMHPNIGLYLINFKKKEEATIVNEFHALTNTSLTYSKSGNVMDQIDNLESLFKNKISSYILENLPQVIYWKYDENFLLPSSINLMQFANTPSLCLPLQSMFNLAGYTDISKAITDAKSGRRTLLENMVDKVALKSTNYLNDVWKDYGNIKLYLALDGDNLNIHIQDEENKYDCDQRSDGFKRFIAFLLALSAKVNHGEIENDIIIIDEPDIALHISGQKYLTEELIKMSEKNLVFYSTHSIFMIDKKQPNRHFIVKKIKEKTIVERVEASNIVDDEVIYRALGYSTFETLKENNLIFEGWSDKKVFDEILKTNDLRLPENLKPFGLTYAKGVSNITPIAKILELADRNYFVISDSDEAAKRSHKEYLEQQRCFGPWYFYGDVIPNIYTLEDFIKHSSFKNPIESSRQTNPQLTKEFDYENFEKRTFKRVEFIKTWVKECTNNNSEKTKEIMMEIKNNLYANISISDVEDLYYDFLIALDGKLQPKKD